MRPTRRRVVAATALFGLAGCVDRSRSGADPSSSPTSSPPSPTPNVPSDLRIDDGTPTVAFPNIADGEVTVEDELLVTYESPVEANFTPMAIRDGTDIEDPFESDRLRVSPAFPADGPPTVYPVAVYREGVGFEYRIYANEAFGSLHEWQMSAGTGSTFDEEGTGSRPAAFERHHEHVLREAVTADLVPDADPGDLLSIGVFQYTIEEIEAERPDDLTGVLLVGQEGSREASQSAPRASFTFDRNGATLTITHDGGDDIDASALTVRIEEEPTETQWADEHEEVTAGDDIGVDLSDASEGDALRVIWENEEGDDTATLAKYSI